MKAAGWTPWLVLLAACGAPTGLEAYGDRARAPSALDARLAPDVHEARAALDSGDAGGARRILEDLSQASPADLGLAVMLQDAELAAGEDPAALRARYLALARDTDDPKVLLLAARLERSAGEARAMLERAARLAPTSAWPRYALAFVQAREGLWGEAQSHLRKALDLDPAHLPARWLEAALLARDGKFGPAKIAYEAWLEASRDDPRVDPAARVAAELDLAIVELESGEARAARARLASLPDSDPGQTSAARRLCLIAAAEHALGRPDLANDAASRAEVAAPAMTLPKVQQALLQAQWLKDPEAARAAWGRVLSEARTSGDLSDLIQSMRARVVLERLDAAVAPQR